MALKSTRKIGVFQVEIKNAQEMQYLRKLNSDIFIICNFETFKKVLFDYTNCNNIKHLQNKSNSQ